MHWDSTNYSKTRPWLAWPEWGRVGPLGLGGGFGYKDRPSGAQLNFSKLATRIGQVGPRPSRAG